MAKYMNLEVSREYKHREYGVIATGTLAINEGEWTLDGKVIAKDGVYHLMNHAMQSLLDAYAGADNLDDAKARYTAKYEKIIAGTLGSRDGSGGVSERHKVARSMVWAVLVEKLGAKSDTIKGLKEDPKARNKLLDSKIEAFTDVSWAKVDAKLALIVKQREDAALIGEVEIDI